MTILDDTVFGTTFAGRKRQMFGLSVSTSLLTVLTLGLYRFWMKTRLRRYYWSSVKPGGTPLEYVGEPMEKLLGFLIAVVFMAFYIGIVNLLLMFASFAVFRGNTPAYLLSFLGVIPLIFFARYRARRYVLARSRWRGIRFGVSEGAWGYAARAMGHWLMILLSLGLWWPRMTFALEKYRIDRTTFGQASLHQGGDWRMLYPAFAHLLIGVVFTILTIMIAVGNDEFRPLIDEDLDDGAPTRIWVLLVVFVPWMIYGLIHYTVEAKRLLANRKRCGPLALLARPRPRRVLRIYLLGGAVVFTVLALLGTLAGLTIYGLMSVYQPDTIVNGSDFDPAAGPRGMITTIGVIFYFIMFLTFGILRHTLITLPLWRHYAETLTITGADGLPDLRQAARDPLAQAEGFAEALDVGAAI